MSSIQTKVLTVPPAAAGSTVVEIAHQLVLPAIAMLVGHVCLFLSC
jgi:hypothetical protein